MGSLQPNTDWTMKSRASLCKLLTSIKGQKNYLKLTLIWYADVDHDLYLTCHHNR
jgi:hypothetical protein